ncbi:MULTISPECIES: hypothetical protein [unclassified Butyrivibrio]|nr:MULTISPECIES: hypothetical protein [unclassified Butyrivibrio]
MAFSSGSVNGGGRNQSTYAYTKREYFGVSKPYDKILSLIL